MPIKKELLPVLRGKKVLLRPLAFEAHRESVLKWLNDPDILVNLEDDIPLKKRGLKRWFSENSTRNEEFSLGDKRLGFAIEVLETGVFIGYMIIHTINWTDRTAFTTSVIGEPEYRRGGYGTDAKMTLLNYALNILKLRKLYAVINAYNEASIRYNERCGYWRVATFPDKVVRSGKIWDEVWISVSLETWSHIWDKYQKTGEI